jgi:hypothetical protein
MQTRKLAFQAAGTLMSVLATCGTNRVPWFTYRGLNRLRASVAFGIARDLVAGVCLCVALPGYGQQAVPTTFSSTAAEAAVTLSTTNRTGPCVEDYLLASDYGQAINAADAALPLTTPTRLNICVQGSHAVGTPIVIDRPIQLWGYGTRLVPTTALQSVPVLLTGCKLTAGSKTVTCTNTSGAIAGMAIGGLGVPETTYIMGVPSSTSLTLSLPANLNFHASDASASTAVTAVSSMKGLAVGTGITGPNIAVSTTISALNYATQSFALSKAANANAVASTTVLFASTWPATLTAEMVTPVITWKHNPAALLNSERQNVGGEMHGVWIADPGFRTLTGVQGVQIYGWDRFKSDDLTVENLAGSALILGGNTPPGTDNSGTVRESNFISNKLRDSGDILSGQPSLQLMTGYNNAATADEINQIGFVGLQAVFNYGEGVTIGSFNPANVNGNGPRLIWFDSNSQIEGGSHVAGQNVNAPADLVHVMSATDVYFDGDELNGPGYGKSIFQIDHALTVSALNSRLRAAGIALTYIVRLTNGSPMVSWVSGGNGSFPASAIVDATGVMIVDSVSCTIAAPCPQYALPTGSVAASGLILSLASKWTGATTSAATLTFSPGGYYLTNTNADLHTSLLGGLWTDAAGATLSLLGSPSDFVFTGIAPTQYAEDREGLSAGPLASGTTAVDGVLSVNGAMVLNSPLFDADQPVFLQNTGNAATATTSYAAPQLTWQGSYWNGTMSATDQIALQPSLIAGTNGFSTLTLAHSGSSNFAFVTPNLSTASILPTTLFDMAGTVLPICSAGIVGEHAVVSDATGPTYMGSYSGGGAMTTAVMCSYNGSSYKWLTY